MYIVALVRNNMVPFNIESFVMVLLLFLTVRSERERLKTQNVVKA